ncbi:oligosaccharide flippase family protein [Agarivorans sp. MS3-6]
MIISNLASRSYSIKYLVNSLWMMLDKFYLLIGGFIITTMVARHIGPELFGQLALGLSIVLAITSISQWGSGFTIFNSSVINKVRAARLISSTVAYRLVIYIIFWCFISALLFVNFPRDDFILIAFVGLSGVFVALDVYQYYFNGVLQSRVNAKVTIFAKTISFAMRFIFVLYSLDIYWLVSSYFLEGFIISYLKRRCMPSSVVSPKIKRAYQKSFFYKGIPLCATTFFTLSYVKINEIVVSDLLGFHAMGQYACALALSAAWTFVPISLGVSLLNKPLSMKDGEEKNKYISFVLLVQVLVSVPVVLFLFVFSDWLVLMTFGAGYADAAKILPFISLAACFSSMGFVSNRVISSYKEGGAYLLKKTLLLSFFSFPFSFYLVSYFGLYGAAMSFLIVELFSVTIFNYFFRSGLLFNGHFALLLTKGRVRVYE